MAEVVEVAVVAGEGGANVELKFVVCSCTLCVAHGFRNVVFYEDGVENR